VLAGIAGSGFLLYLFGMRETGDIAKAGQDKTATAAEIR
jgi:hypothetical protein